MRIWMDWEFLEDGKTIEPISVGLVAEDDGREYYAVNRQMAAERIAENGWLMANVVPSLPRLYGEERMAKRGWNPLGINWNAASVKTIQQIAKDVRDFIRLTPHPQLWGWYAAYDHVCLAQLFGRMIDLPPGIPMFTCDLKQEAVRLGVADEDLPKQAGTVHNALHDARHNRAIAVYLDMIEQGVLGGRGV